MGMALGQLEHQLTAFADKFGRDQQPPSSYCKGKEFETALLEHIVNREDDLIHSQKPQFGSATLA